MQLRLRALARAQSYIGTSEQPPGSNDGRLVRRWLENAGVGPGNPWCASFVFSMFLEEGAKLGIVGPASVYNWSTWADANGYRQKRPFRGDLIAYSWGGPRNDPGDHIGFVEKVLALPWPRNGWKFYVRTVEGNSNDRVERRWRWVSPDTVAFIRVPG